MIKALSAVMLATSIVLAGCQSTNSRGNARSEAPQAGVNPYLWRAALDTLAPLPLDKADPIGGIIIYDWKSFPNAPGERIKATVFILDSRLRADGVKVSVFRQTETGGVWSDAPVDPDTAIQLENEILERARLLRSSEIS